MANQAHRDKNDSANCTIILGTLLPRTEANTNTRIF